MSSFSKKLCSLSLTHLGDHSVSLGKIKVYSDLADGATVEYIKGKNKKEDRDKRKEKSKR